MTGATREFRAAALREMGLAPLWVRRARKLPGEAGHDAVEDPSRRQALTSPSDEKSVSAFLDGPSRPLETQTTQPAELPGSERTVRIARLDWETLEKEVHACQACPLGRTRKQAVFGVGERRPEWLFVGEAPGAEEDAQGEPFVGEAGRLLDNMLAAIGLNRQQGVYIANVMKCRPPRNRDPESGEVIQCFPYLARQIALLAPRIVVALGRFAAESVLGVEATVGSLRGRVHQAEVGSQSFPVVVTYHPAYLLRNLAEKRKAWDDLCLARATLGKLERL